MIDDLINAYRNAAIAYGKATMSGNSKRTNRAHDDLQDIMKQITNVKADTALIELISDDEPWVQLWAAAHYLEIDVRKAKAKLKSLGDANVPFISLSARCTLQEWESGLLKFRT